MNARKEGRWVHSSRPGRQAPAAVRAALDWVHLSVAQSDKAVADARRLEQVIRRDLTDLCRKQCRA